LHGAAKKGHYNICKYLIEHGALLDAQTMTGSTPLYTAVEEGHLDIVQLLCEKGADLNKCPSGDAAKELDIHLQSPLLLASLKNNTEVSWPFFFAFHSNFFGFSNTFYPEQMMELLIKFGANVNFVNERGSSVLLFVCQYDNLRILKLLIEKGVKIDQEAFNMYDAKINALIIATESGSFSCVKCLVDYGLDVNYKIKGKGETSGRTPLFCASVKNHPEIVEYLAVHGADVNATEDVSSFRFSSFLNP
jgi:ankyrin repeat protein